MAVERSTLDDVGELRSLQRLIERHGAGVLLAPARAPRARPALSDREFAVVALEHLADSARGSERPLLGVAGLAASLAARPPLVVSRGTFVAVPPRWKQLERHRDSIDRVIASVGRVELAAGNAQSALGTGFVVGENLVMTNRHVVAHFADPRGTSWQIRADSAPRIDFAEERDGDMEPREHAITDVVFCPEDVDLALVTITARSERGDPCPPPLPIARHPRPRPQRRSIAYVVGYPGPPREESVREAADAAFGGWYDVKRLQPGRLLYSRGARLAHDCSTLIGNSGSCLVSLASGKVLGLHYEGTRRENRAVPLWKTPALHPMPLHWD